MGYTIEKSKYTLNGPECKHCKHNKYHVVIMRVHIRGVPQTNVYFRECAKCNTRKLFGSVQRRK